MKLPAIELPASLGKIPGLSRFMKAKGGMPGAAGGAKPGSKALGTSAASHEQQVIGRLDLTMKGFAVLAFVLVILALYTVFAQNGLNKAIITAAPPTIDLAELAAATSDEGADDPGSGAKGAKASKASASARVKLPEGTDARLDFAFEQIANFENTRSEAILRNSKAIVGAVAPGSPSARAGFVPGDLILGVDGDQAGFVWDALRKLTAAGKSSVLIEVQRGPEVLRGELFAPEGELLTSSNSGLFFQIPEGYRFVGENDRRDLRNAFARSYLEGLAGDERLAYATSLAILGANLVKRGVGQTKLQPSDPNWLKTELILSDHHNKFNKVLTQHTAQIEGMQAQLSAGFVKVGAYLLAALLATVAAIAAGVQYNKHLADQAMGQVRAQFQGLRAEFDQWMHAQRAAADLAMPVAQGAQEAKRHEAVEIRAGQGERVGATPTSRAAPVAAGASLAALSLAELAARVALGGDNEDEATRSTGTGGSGLRSADAKEEPTKIPFSGLPSDARPPQEADLKLSDAPDSVSETTRMLSADGETARTLSADGETVRTVIAEGEAASEGLAEDLKAPTEVGDGEVSPMNSGDRQADRKVATGDVA